jgi:hypothetical protein
MGTNCDELGTENQDLTTLSSYLYECIEFHMFTIYKMWKIIFFVLDIT